MTELVETDQRAYRLLYLAVIERAVQDLDDRDPAVRSEAEGWLYSAYDNGTPERQHRDMVFENAQVSLGQVRRANQHKRSK